MARHKAIITTYGFKKPQVPSENEFNSFKQIFSVEPDYNLAPKLIFWQEFAFIKWLLIILIFSGLLSTTWEPFGIIACVALLFLVFGLIGGVGASMANYQSFLNTKNKYYNSLRDTIKSSNNYDEFKHKAAHL